MTSGGRSAQPKTRVHSTSRTVCIHRRKQSHQRHDGYWPRTDSGAYVILWTVGSGLITAGIFIGVYELVLSPGGGKLTRAAASLVTLVLQYGGAILSPSHPIGHYIERTRSVRSRVNEGRDKSDDNPYRQEVH